MKPYTFISAERSCCLFHTMRSFTLASLSDIPLSPVFVYLWAKTTKSHTKNGADNPCCLRASIVQHMALFPPHTFPHFPHKLSHCWIHTAYLCSNLYTPRWTHIAIYLYSNTHTCTVFILCTPPHWELYQWESCPSFHNQQEKPCWSTFLKERGGRGWRRGWHRDAGGVQRSKFCRGECNKALRRTCKEWRKKRRAKKSGRHSVAMKVLR